MCLSAHLRIGSLIRTIVLTNITNSMNKFNVEGKTEAAAKFEIIGLIRSDISNPAPGMPPQEFHSVKLQELDEDETNAESSGRAVNKTVFHDTHPKGYKVVQYWLDHDKQPKCTFVGKKVTVPLVAGVKYQQQQFNEKTNTWELRVDKEGKPVTATTITLFLFKDENLQDELNRRERRMVFKFDETPKESPTIAETQDI